MQRGTMLTKRTKRKLGVVKRAEILLKLTGQDADAFDDAYKSFSAQQARELRDFLEQQVLHFSKKKDEEAFSLEAVKEKMEPIPNYFYKQDCREPMESCFNETCLASNPGCFKKKIKGQLAVILDLLDNYIIANHTNGKLDS